MTDPKVIEAIRKISNAVYAIIPDGDTPERLKALGLLDAVDMALADALLAAAEKPAAPVATPVASGEEERSAEDEFANGATVMRSLAVDAIRRITLPALPAAPVPAPVGGIEAELQREQALTRALSARLSPPVAPSLPWVVRWKHDRKELARCASDEAAWHLLRYYQSDNAVSDFEVVEVAPAAAKPVVPVKFTEHGYAVGKGWSASVRDSGNPVLSIAIDLRPGEDAGERTARMLASVGRGL